MMTPTARGRRRRSIAAATGRPPAGSRVPVSGRALTVSAATKRELEALGEGVTDSALGATALNLARRIDHARTTPHAAANLAAELRAALREIRVLAEANTPSADLVDELQERAQAKLRVVS